MPNTGRMNYATNKRTKNRQHNLANPRTEADDQRARAGRKLIELSKVVGNEKANRINLHYYDTFEVSPTDWKHYYEYLDNILVAEVHGEEWQLRQQELNLEEAADNLRLHDCTCQPYHSSETGAIEERPCPMCVEKFHNEPLPF